MKGKYEFKAVVMTMAVIVGSVSLTACSNSIDDLADVEEKRLVIDGNCDIHTLTNDESASWSIEDAPAWVTPVKGKGTSDDDIQLYVESNNVSPREGIVTIKYSNGISRSVAVSQSTDQSRPSLQRTYAVGWSFDVRTFMDFRGLKEQIFNTQKMQNYDDENFKYMISRDPSTSIDYYYGESASDLSDDISAKLNLNGKYNTFGLELQASFGKSAISNSKRIFSRIRSKYQQCVVYFSQLDFSTIQRENLFTADFAAERQKVIDAQYSDESIRNLIERYDTHLVISASLGGYYDYYFSAVVENMSNDLNVEGAIKLGFAEKFKLEGNAQYKDDLEKLSNEKIETFSVRGGDAIMLSTAVETGTIDQSTTDEWLATLNDDEKYELLSFELVPISMLFPLVDRKKIDNYTDRMYYSEVPVTRSANN